ncbi:MAG: dockerin type I repeat-containing protein [Clostridia bacterium]|nr:dockerin type I repeat-containing protein [Clostridia bacterium]
MKLKHLLSVLLAALLLLCVLTPAFAEEPETPGEPETGETEPGGEEPDVPPVGEEPEDPEEPDAPAALSGIAGDVDNDYVVTAADARIALRAAVGLEELTGDAFTVADMDEDNLITAADARVILRLAVGLPAEEPDDPTPPVTPGGPYPEPVDPHETPSQRTLVFNTMLYEHSHRFKGYSALDMERAWGGSSVVGMAYRASTDWCCYYTIKDVFRPVLETMGYTEAQMDKIAPRYHDSDKVQKAIKKGVNMNIPSALIGLKLIETYVPSLLGDYYLCHPEYATTYTFVSYYDDIVTERAYTRSANANSYYPKVGDILFMSNKTSTYVNGLPTVDHTAQITQVYADGTFLCTEGALMYDTPRVTERVYYFDRQMGTWRYEPLAEVITLVIARPNMNVSG